MIVKQHICYCSNQFLSFYCNWFSGIPSCIFPVRILPYGICPLRSSLMDFCSCPFRASMVFGNSSISAVRTATHMSDASAPNAYHRLILGYLSAASHKACFTGYSLALRILMFHRPFEYIQWTRPPFLLLARFVSEAFSSPLTFFCIPFVLCFSH